MPEGLRLQTGSDLFRDVTGCGRGAVRDDDLNQTGIGRVRHQFAKLDLMTEESRVILPPGELQRIMVGVERLDYHLARSFAPSGAAGYLCKELEGALGRAEIGEGKACVGSDHANQCDIGKIMALGEHLRPHQDVEPPLLEGRESLAQRALLACCIPVQARNPGSGKHSAQGLLELFGARAHKVDVLSSATAASRGSIPLQTAVVTDEPPLRLVIGHGNAALRAGIRMAAAATKQGPRISSAIQQHDRLLSSAERIPKLLPQQVRDDDLLAVALELEAHVDDYGRGKRSGVNPFRQAEVHYLSVFSRCVKRLDRGRRRSEQEETSRPLDAVPRHFSGVIIRRFILLIGRVLFFVDDDQTQVFQRREDCGARSDYYRCKAGSDPVPLIVPLPQRHGAVQKRDTVRKMRNGNPAQQRSQADLRNQQHGRIIGLQRLTDKPQIDFGLATARAGCHDEWPGRGSEQPLDRLRLVLPRALVPGPALHHASQPRIDWELSPPFSRPEGPVGLEERLLSEEPRPVDCVRSRCGQRSLRTRQRCLDLGSALI